MECQTCQAKLLEGSRFCSQCGSSLLQACPSCGFVSLSTNRFCPRCGGPVSESSCSEVPPSLQVYTPKYLTEQVLLSRGALEGERKQVTVLFCDIVNSTPLTEILGPDRMHGLLNQFFDLALQKVHRYEGIISQFLGDGFMALFGAPLALEDHGRRAVLAAVEIRNKLAFLDTTIDKVKISVRMGLNSGIVVVGKIGDNLRMDYTAVGDTTNLAARLQQNAEPNSIYISDRLHRTIHPYFECQSLPIRLLKGISKPVPIFKIIAPRMKPTAIDAARWLHSPLVGHETHFATLKRSLGKLTTGRGEIISITGEAGLGKSRLIAEARRHPAGQEILWLEGRGLSFSQNISYWPFLEILKGYTGITENDSELSAWEKLEHQIGVLFSDEQEEILPYLATLIGLPIREEWADRVKYLDPKAIRQQIFLTVRRLFDRLAQQRPLVIIFEDVHWIDESSADLIEHLFPLTETAPILIWMTARRVSFGAPARLLERAAKNFIARHNGIVLTPLSFQDGKQLLCNLLDTKILNEKLQKSILEKAEGNPLFLEEVVRTLMDNGALVQDNRSGQWRLTIAFEQIILPDTLHGVIMTRVDRLSDDVKEALKIAAVIGRSFLYRVLQQIETMEATNVELEERLEKLQVVDLIRIKSQFPELEYIFKHQLVQEATYESILLQRRQHLHHLVSQCIETVFADRVEDFFGVLAYHYARAEDWKKAQEYLFKAGDQAVRVAADAEALEHYRQALSLCSKESLDWTNVERGMLESKMGEALFRRGQHVEAMGHLRRALSFLNLEYPGSDRAVIFGIIKHLFLQVGHQLFPRAFRIGQTQQASAVTEERSRIFEVLGWIHYFSDPKCFLLDVLMGLNLDERDGFSIGIARTSTAAGIICDMLPSYGLGGKYHCKAAMLAEQLQHPIVTGMTYLGLALHKHHYSGQWNSALDDYQRSTAAYYQAGHLRGWGGALWWMAWLLYLQGQFVQSLKHFNDIIRVGKDVADHQVWGWGLRGAGRVLSQMGSIEEAIDHLETATDVLKSIPDPSSVARTMSNLGECYLQQGMVHKALVKFEESYSLLMKNGFKGFLATDVRNGLPEGYLTAADQATGLEKAMFLKKAKQACRAALRNSKVDIEARAGAMRLKGTCEWISGRTGSAQEWWDRSLSFADKLGARYEVARICLEMGRRLNDQAYSQRGEKIFAEMCLTDTTQEMLNSQPKL